MKKKIVPVLLLILLMVFAMSAQGTPEVPVVNFSVVAEKEVEADTLVVRVQMEKKDKVFKTASNEIAKLIEQIITKLKRDGVDEENIVVDKLSSYPDIKWWNGKEYVIKTRIKIKIQDKNLASAVFSSISSFGNTVTVLETDYEFSNLEEIRGNLIAEGAKIANQRKELYEKNFGIKLAIQSINVNENLGEHYPVLTRNLRVSENSEMAESVDLAIEKKDNFRKLPVKKMKMSFYLRYSILN